MYQPLILVSFYTVNSQVGLLAASNKTSTLLILYIGFIVFKGHLLYAYSMQGFRKDFEGKMNTNINRT